MEFIRKRDLIIITVVLIFLLSIWIILSNSLGEKSNTATISYYGEKIQIVNLNLDQTIEIEQAPNVIIKVKNGEIFFEHSDCKDKICINSGKLSHAGQSAACLPNGVVVTIDSNKLDAIT